MQHKYQLFETCIYEKTCDLDLEELFDRCRQHQRLVESIKMSNWDGGYQGHGFHDSEFESMIRQCYPRNSQGLELSVNIQSWVNINGPGHWNALHNHLDEQCLLSGVFYVRCPPKSGDIFFYDPRYLSSVGTHFRYYNQGDGGYLALTPKDNMLLFFPPSLFHMVSPNMSQQERCSIAFNIMVAPHTQNQ